MAAFPPPLPFTPDDNDPEATLSNLEKYYEGFKMFINPRNLTEEEKLTHALRFGGPGLKPFLENTCQLDLESGNVSFTSVFETSIELLMQTISKQKNMDIFLPPEPFNPDDNNLETTLGNLELFYQDVQEYISAYISAHGNIPESTKLQMAIGFGGQGLQNVLMNTGNQDINSADANFTTVFESTFDVLRKKISEENNSHLFPALPPQPFKLIEGDLEKTLQNLEEFYKEFKSYLVPFTRQNSKEYSENKNLQLALRFGGQELKDLFLDEGNQDINSADANFTTVFESTFDVLRKKISEENNSHLFPALPPQPFKLIEGDLEKTLQNLEEFYKEFKSYLVPFTRQNAKECSENKNLQLALRFGGQELKDLFLDVGNQDINSADANFTTVFEATFDVLREKISEELAKLKQSNVSQHIHHKMSKVTMNITRNGVPISLEELSPSQRKFFLENNDYSSPEEIAASLRNLKSIGEKEKHALNKTSIPQSLHLISKPADKAFGTAINNATKKAAEGGAELLSEGKYNTYMFL